MSNESGGTTTVVAIHAVPVVNTNTTANTSSSGRGGRGRGGSSSGRGRGGRGGRHHQGGRGNSSGGGGGGGRGGRTSAGNSSERNITAAGESTAEVRATTATTATSIVDVDTAGVIVSHHPSNVNNNNNEETTSVASQYSSSSKTTTATASTRPTRGSGRNSNVTTRGGGGRGRGERGGGGGGRSNHNPNSNSSRGETRTDGGRGRGRGRHHNHHHESNTTTTNTEAESTTEATTTTEATAAATTTTHTGTDSVQQQQVSPDNSSHRNNDSSSSRRPPNEREKGRSGNNNRNNNNNNNRSTAAGAGRGDERGARDSGGGGGGGGGREPSRGGGGRSGRGRGSGRDNGRTGNNSHNRKGATEQQQSQQQQHHNTRNGGTTKQSHPPSTTTTNTMMIEEDVDDVQRPPAIMSEQQLSNALESIFNANTAAATTTSTTSTTTLTSTINVDDQLKKLLSIPTSSDNDPFLKSLQLTPTRAIMSTTSISSPIHSTTAVSQQQQQQHLHLPPTPAIFLAAAPVASGTNSSSEKGRFSTANNKSTKKNHPNNNKGGGGKASTTSSKAPMVITRETVFAQQQQQHQRLGNNNNFGEGLYNDDLDATDDEPHLSELLAEAALFDDFDDDDDDDFDNKNHNNNMNLTSTASTTLLPSSLSSPSSIALMGLGGSNHHHSLLLSQDEQSKHFDSTVAPATTTGTTPTSSILSIEPPTSKPFIQSSSLFDVPNDGDYATASAATITSSTSSYATNNNTKASSLLPSLPSIPHSATKGRGGVMILQRNNNNNPQQQPPPSSSETASISSTSSFQSMNLKEKAPLKPDKKKKKTPQQKKKKNVVGGDNTEGADTEGNADTTGTTNDATAGQPPPTATQALKALPAQEVSITASTQVKMVRNESVVSLHEAAASGGGSLLGGGHSKGNDPSNKKIKGKNHNSSKKFLSDDLKANRSAARRFNNDVKTCVERSDPDGLHELLHDRRNHNFALDDVVLEVVMKAYVMAAMFDDALYCLRNCAVPSTLSTIQTERILACMPQNLRSSNAYTAADMINQLCINTIFDNATSRTYFGRIVRGIALEFLEEAMSARDRICSAPCERLVRAGTCVVDARLERGKKPSDLIVVPGDQLGVWQSDTLENRGIQAGDAVSILPYAGPYPMSAESLDRNMIEATITNTNPMVLRLQDKANAKLHNMLTENIDGNVFRIDKLANRMGFNRQLSAAVAIASPLGDMNSPDYVRDVRRPCPEIIQAVTAMNENFEQFITNKEPSATGVATSTSKAKASGGGGTATLTSTAALCATAVPWNIEDEVNGIDQDSIRATSRLALEKYGALEGLNESQQLAVECATTNRLTLVQGPPGTGKTRIAICILEHWGRLALAAAEKGEDPAPILATSDSNIAVDNLVEGCSAVGLRVVRLGRPEAIRPELLRYCIDRPPSSYDANKFNGSASNQGNSTPSNFNTAHKERMKQLKSAQIICCTCIGSGGDILDSLGPFERVLVDEATQATEPAVLVPLMRGCRQLVLVGDHCQLPPTVLSTRAEEEGHGVPLFSRMVACGVPPHMLDTQYRMHPGIAMFPSDLFYGGLLKNGVSAPERRPLAGFPWPREEFPVAFIPVRGVEMDDGVSKYNEEEAKTACEAVDMLLRGGQCSVSDIAVVTPYAAQARLIRRMTRRMTDNSGPPYIEVSSVDGFQGREKEAVVFSAVRSNDYGAIGFTSDWRRINVSFTRARRALVVIGNDQTLRRGDPDTWMPWLAWADAHGVNVEKPGIARGRYEPEQLRRVRGGTTAAEMLKDVLARQQAQLKQAEHQQERAEKNSAGHIVGSADVDDGLTTAPSISLEEDLARLQNTDGNWDDSDDDDHDPNKKILAHSGSRITLASGASSNDVRSSGYNDGDDDNSTGPKDVWDL